MRFDLCMTSHGKIHINKTRALVKLIQSLALNIEITFADDCCLLQHIIGRAVARLFFWGGGCFTFDCFGAP